MSEAPIIAEDSEEAVAHLHSIETLYDQVQQGIAQAQAQAQGFDYFIVHSPYSSELESLEQQFSTTHKTKIVEVTGSQALIISWQGRISEGMIADAHIVILNGEPVATIHGEVHASTLQIIEPEF